MLDRDGEFVSFDEVRISYRVRSASGPGAGERQYRLEADGPPSRPVLLHHGLAADSETTWMRSGVVEALTAADRDVVLFDARGHGRSDKPHVSSAYEGRALERDVEALVEHLRIKSFDLAGFSMGAVVAMGVAVSRFGTSRLRRLVLAGAGLGMILASYEVRARVADVFEAVDSESIEDRPSKALRMVAESAGADLLALAALQRAHISLAQPDELVRIKARTLILNGDRDSVAGQPGALAAVIPGAVSVVVPGNHLSSPGAPEFSAAIVDFLRNGGCGAD